MNAKRVYRLYKLEGLSVRTKKRKKRRSHLRVVPNPPTQPNERWCMDFVQDSLIDGRKFRALTVVDVFTRECLAVHADSSLSGSQGGNDPRWRGQAARPCRPDHRRQRH